MPSNCCSNCCSNGLRASGAGRWLAVLLLTAGLVGADSLHARAADGDKKASRKSGEADLALRPYSDGPLTAEDFRCPPPNPVPQKNGVYLSAMTYTTLHYSTRYRWHEPTPKNFEARLTHFEIVAQVDRRQSWTTRPTDDRLLDHEQGHFDVIEAWARRIQKNINAMISAGTMIGHGDTEAAAISDLNHQVDVRVDDLMAAERKAQDQYDIATRHGTDRLAQAMERRNQVAALKEKSTPPKKPAPAAAAAD